jgi:hypothetical protein
MGNIVFLFPLMTSGPPIIAGAVIAVLQAFNVIVGVALARFLRDQPLVVESEYEGERRELLYWSTLIIMVTLAIRFLVGSYVHLHMSYAKPPTPHDFHLFLKDLFFLFAFGAFLVRTSFSTTCRDFLRWIMIFSITDVVWCWIEIKYRPEPLAWNWMWIGLVQLAITSICWMFLLRVKQSSRNLGIFAFLVIVFVALFWIDLKQILFASGWTRFP